LQLQEIALAKGLIPYIPAQKESSSAAEHGPKTRPEEPEATTPAPVERRRKQAREVPEADNGQLGLF
jgi:hypothetical protein